MMKKIFCFFLFLSFLFMLAFVAHASSLTTDNSFIMPQYSKRLSLDFKDADIKDVLKVFSQQIGSNFIVSDKVKDKKITVFLDKVPVEEGLTKILVANGLVYRFDQGSNIFIVDLKDETEKLLTRVYPLKYATVPSSKILSMFTISDDDISTTSSSSSSTTTSSTASTPSSSSNEGGIVDPIKSVLTKSGKIAVDERTNSLIVTDIEQNFFAIEQTIAKLDVPIPQVLIQVEMIDTTKSALDELGVKFGDTLYGINGLGGKTFVFPLGGKTLAKNAETKYTYGNFNGGLFSAALQFLTTRTDTKNLARPRILTMDNQTAQIKISTDQVVGVTRTSAGSDSTAAVTETAERMTTGIILTVTPQVNLLSGDIMMAVSPKVIDVTQSPLGSYMDPETRGAKVMMRVHDGETIALGGLLRSNKETTITKIPILGDIPFLGRAFRHKNQSTKERELIIFITPHILSGNGISSGATETFANMDDRESSVSGKSQEMASELDRASTRKNLR